MRPAAGLIDAQVDAAESIFRKRLVMSNKYLLESYPSFFDLINNIKEFSI